MKRRIVSAMFLLLVGFCSGIYVGYRFLGKPEQQMAAIGESFKAEQYAILQYRQAAYPEARHALEAYLQYLDSHTPSDTSSWRHGQNPWLDQRGINFDKTLTLVRLALLHERNANISQAEVTWQRIDVLTSRLNWRDRSRHHVRELVASMDRPTGAPAESSGTVPTGPTPP